MAETVKQQVKDLEIENKALKRTIAGYVKEQRAKPAVVPCRTQTYRFALLGDLHLGSKYERIDAVLSFLKEVKKQKIRDIYIAGDILDGWRMYKGHDFTVHKRGQSEQLSWAAKQLATATKPFKVKFVTGNHDTSFEALTGVDIGYAISSAMGWECIGDIQGDVNVATPNGSEFKMALLHPGGGTAYALSYKPQKIVEQWAGGSKPHLIAIGHFHKAEMMPKYRNVMTLQVGCFQAQTDYMLRKHTDAHVGGWLVEVAIGKKVNRIKPEFIAYY